MNDIESRIDSLLSQGWRIVESSFDPMAPIDESLWFRDGVYKRLFELLGTPEPTNQCNQTNPNSLEPSNNLLHMEERNQNVLSANPSTPSQFGETLSGTKQE